MQRILIGTASIAVLILGNSAIGAQDNGPAIRVTDNGTPAIYRHASTLEEGFFRGLADLERAAGDALYNTSLAAINMQEVRRRSIANRLAEVEAYYEIKRMNREYKQYNRRVVTAEQAKALSDAHKDRLLTDQEYDREVGRLFWPELLQGEEFKDQREKIDAIAARGSLKGQLTWDLAKEMEDILITMVTEQDSLYYIAARVFIKGLKMEAISK